MSAIERQASMGTDVAYELVVEPTREAAELIVSKTPWRGSNAPEAALVEYIEKALQMLAEPRPEEPSGAGAVVRDRGAMWVRVSTLASTGRLLAAHPDCDPGSDHLWRREDSDGWCSWESFSDDVEVLALGVVVGS